MARFYPLYVRRSDGKQAVVAKGKRRELNQPTDDQLDQRPDKDGVSDYYRELGVDSPKHLDWRRKLGGMLARELDWKDKSGSDNGYMLVALPENYRLYEHVKKTEKDGQLEVKSKTHAAGGNDRQDAYLYGHPAGRRKRFRSPNDFFPHLLWLCTDESGDPDNCSCKICSPEDLDNLLPALQTKQEKGVKKEDAASMVRQASQQGTKVKHEAPTTAQRPPPPATSAHVKLPAPLPKPRTLDQETDRLYDYFMFRNGELVWFKRGQAWGLGVVVRRWTPDGRPNMHNYCYEVQPLSHPYTYPKSLTVAANTEMRPWLAWSLPKYTMPGLNDVPNPARYETADWTGMAQGRYGRGDLEVDASILAAKAIDSTYTLYDKLQTVQSEPGTFTSNYNGIYLGAERMWVGDPVRLAVGNGTDILVVSHIVEQKKVSAMNNQTLQTTVRLVGDIYRLSTKAHNNPQLPTPAAPSENPQLPQRLTQDLAYRNARSIQIKGQCSWWQLIGTQQRVDLDTIKGRWYEASLLLPIVDPNRFAEANRKADFQESSLWMNSRGDCLNSNRAPQLPKIPRENIRKETRKEAFGKSLPPAMEIRDGLAPPLLENVDPGLGGADENNAIDIDAKFDTADDAGDQAEQANNFDELMNLDGLDDGGQFGEFSGQGQTPAYF